MEYNEHSLTLDSLISIFSFLSEDDLIRVSCVCKVRRFYRTRKLASSLSPHSFSDQVPPLVLGLASVSYSLQIGQVAYQHPITSQKAGFIKHGREKKINRQPTFVFQQIVLLVNNQTLNHFTCQNIRYVICSTIFSDFVAIFCMIYTLLNIHFELICLI